LIIVVRYLNFHFTPFNVLIADSVYVIQRGDAALASRKEKISTHYFPPDDTNERTIWFKGYYLSIYNKQTEDYKTYIDNEVATTEFEKYKVPTGYTVYVRRARVYFEV